MTVVGVADTHTALWYVFGDARLSKRARNFIDNAGQDYEDLRKALNDPDHVLAVAPITPEVIESMRLVPRDVVPDMPDRIVAGTAIHLGVPVISRDALIRASSVETIW